MLNGLSALLEVIAIGLCINFMYSKQLRFGRYDVIYFLLQLLVVEGANFLKLGKSVIIVSYLIILLYQFIKFQTDLKHICINFTVFICLLVMIELISSVPLIFLQRILSEEILVFSSTFCMTVIIVLLGWKGLLYRIFRYTLQFAWLEKVCFFCCFVGGIYLIVIYKLDEYLRPTDYIIFCTWTILIFVIAVNWQKTKEEYRIQVMERKLERVYDEYAKELFDSVVHKQHDFDNYLQALLTQSELSGNESPQARQLINEIKRDNRYNKLLASGNSLLVGFLYSKFMKAEKEKGWVTYQVRVSEMKCSLPFYRIIELLGILLDNAIEAIREYERKNIVVHVIEDEEGISIRIENSYAFVAREEFHQWFQEGVSGKGKGRGLGLANVMKIAQDYDLVLRAYCDGHSVDNHVVFELFIEK